MALVACRCIVGVAVAGAKIHRGGAGIIRDRIPNSASPAMLPPLAVPGLGGHPQCAALEAVGGGSRDRVKTPEHFAILCVIGGERTPPHSQSPRGDPEHLVRPNQP